MRVAGSPAARRTASWRLSSFAPTMAVGILSIAARLHGEAEISAALVVLSVAAFAVSVVRNVHAIVAGVDRDQAAPALVLFTWVAACGVLSQELDGAIPPAAAGLRLLAVAGIGGAFIALAQALRSPLADAMGNVRGSWLLAAVALQSLSILCSGTRVGPLAACAIALWGAGLATYGFLAALILRRLVRKEVGVEDLTADYWIAMGALAISSVATTQIGPLASLALPVWVAAAAWIPYLCVMEALRLRRNRVALRYDLLRWSTAFPLGMFSVATHDLGRSVLAPVGVAFLWAGIGVAMWNLAAGARDLRPDRLVS